MEEKTVIKLDTDEIKQAVVAWINSQKENVGDEKVNPSSITFYSSTTPVVITEVRIEA